MSRQPPPSLCNQKLLLCKLESCLEEWRAQEQAVYHACVYAPSCTQLMPLPRTYQSDINLLSQLDLCNSVDDALTSKTFVLCVCCAVNHAPT